MSSLKECDVSVWASINDFDLWSSFRKQRQNNAAKASYWTVLRGRDGLSWKAAARVPDGDFSVLCHQVSSVMQPRLGVAVKVFCRCDWSPYSVHLKQGLMWSAERPWKQSYILPGRRRRKNFIWDSSFSSCFRIPAACPAAYAMDVTLAQPVQQSCTPTPCSKSLNM